MLFQRGEFMDDFAKELEKDFLDEAFSLIDNLETHLLELEKNPNETKAINELFRAAHTIKGGAGTVGFEEIQSLTHTMEDVMDLVRKSKLELSPDNITVLLKTRDEIEHMLDARQNNEQYLSPQTQSIINALNEIKSTVAEPQKNTSQSTPPLQVDFNEDLSSYEISLISDSLVKGNHVFILKYSLNENYEMKEVSAFQLHSLLNDASDIIKVNPPIEIMEEQFSPKVLFVISTDKDAAYIQDKTFLSEMVNRLDIVKIDNQKLHQLENDNSTQEKEAKAADAPQDAKKIDEGDDSTAKRALNTLRIESWKVDNLLNLLGELVITKATFSQLDQDFDYITNELRSRLKNFLSGMLGIEINSAEQKAQYEMYLKIFDKLFKSMESYSESIQKLNRISSSLQENVMNMRMVPIQMVFSRFPRLIRDIAKKMDKEIDLIIEGVETEIDKGMVDDIFDPLIHMLRNAVDHGIESPQIRKENGKDPIGKIVLKAVHEGDSIMIEVSDDGQGIDPEKLRDKAISTGFLTQAQVSKMSRRELLGLIFLPGLSTAKTISNISGRGVGMDVVKKKIEEIGGSVSISTIKNKGSKFTIRLPLTLAIIQGLLIIVERMNFVIPVASVEETVIITRDQLKTINGHLAFEFREKLIPVLSLKKYFYNIENDNNADAKEYCIITRYGDRVVGIIVNEVIGEQDIVIKPLNTKLIKSPGISAATIVGNGEIGFILDTSKVISHYFQSSK